MENAYGGLLTDDQYFLLSFIIGTYFAPHLKKERPIKSASQRLAENLPLYTADDLSNSQIKTQVLESVYHYILREAPQSVTVSRPLFIQFIHADIPIPLVSHSAAYPRFNDLFPPELHKCSHVKNQCDSIQSIVFIENPETGYILPQHVERFKRLTCLEDFQLDRDSAILHVFTDKETSKFGENNMLSNCAIPFSSSVLDQGTLFLPSCPSKEEWSNLVGTIRSGSFAVTGSAARGLIGPVLGLMDIGESEDAYLFRVSLPGVKRDEKDFSCEVETNGTVVINGVTVTGEGTVERYSQRFEMKSQNLCPPGPFSISFELPGPVDPQQFHGTFSTDGILEGIALKARRRHVG